MRVGEHAGAGFDKKVGLPLELLPETDPYSWSRGAPFVLRVELEGKPLADRQVQLVRIDTPHERLVARTDQDGRVRFEPKQGGAWAAFCLHQRRAAEELEGDWEGFWGSLTFELAPAAGEEEAASRGG